MKKLILIFSLALLSLNVAANNPNPTTSDLQQGIQTNTMLLKQLQSHLAAINTLLMSSLEHIHQRLDTKTSKKNSFYLKWRSYEKNNTYTCCSYSTLIH